MTYNLNAEQLINYKKQIIYIKYVFTHAEYDKEAWKNDYYF
ncbi:type II toxin-antitoxin system HigB family toxin [Microcoleus sp. BR0-C5]